MTQIIMPLRSNLVRCAHALHKTRGMELTSEQKRVARHLAREPGTTITAIGMGIGWTGSWGVLRTQLIRNNIRTHQSWMQRRHS